MGFTSVMKTDLSHGHVTVYITEAQGKGGGHLQWLRNKEGLVSGKKPYDLPITFLCEIES